MNPGSLGTCELGLRETGLQRGLLHKHAHSCAQHEQYLNSHDSVTCKHQDRLVEVSLLSGGHSQK